MFTTIPEVIMQRMRHLENLDARDRYDGTPQTKRLRQVPPETGKFIALLAASAPEGQYFEIGTSAGYSTLWLAMACRDVERSITTIEVSPDKVELARETFRAANVEDAVNLVQADALDYVQQTSEIAFCFLDAEKDVYLPCYEKLIPRMVPGGLLVADNVISHRDELLTFVGRAYEDERVDALVVPIGEGVLVCRKGFV